MLERILKFSLAHRLLVLLLTLGAGTIGAWSLTRLPIDAVPDITNNQVQINALAPALSPSDVEKQVTFPVETALAGIPGLEYTRSISRNGFSQVTVVFDDSVDIYFARQQVTERLTEARENLPPGVEPQMGPISTGLGEVYMYAVEYTKPASEPGGDGKPGWQSDGSYLTPEGERLHTRVEKAAYLRTVQDWIVRPQLKNVPGVAGVDSIGGYEKQYHVQPDPMKLVSFNLTFHDVIEALERNNVSTGAGFIEHKGESYVVRADGRVRTLAEIASIVVGERGGTPIRLQAVADILIGPELRTGAASQEGEDAVVGTALMLIGANSRTVATAVDDKIKEIRKGLPPSVEIRTALNRMELVNKTIHTVQKNLAEGAILVIVILFVMLGNFRAALITAFAIPLSMLLTSTAMVQGKISGNLMSLGAIDFGLIVDGAVIIVENCLRHLAEKQHALGRRLTLKERLDVVFHASKEVRQATAFGEAIIIIVYFPILTLTGVEGKMFRPMAATVIIALAAAFVLSLTFVPAAVAVFVNGRVTEKENILVRASKAAYAPILAIAVKLRWIVVGAAVALFVASVALFSTLGQEFIPTLDEGNFAMHAMRIPSTGIEQSALMQLEVEKAVSGIPEVDFVFSKTGTAEVASDPMPPNVSDTFIMMKPVEKWPDPGAPKWEVRERIEETVMKIPGNNYEFTQPIQMRFNELIAGVRGDVAIKVFGDEFDRMLPTAQSIASALQDIPGAADVKVEQVEGLPVMAIDIDRDAIARYGISMADVQDVIAIAVGGREAGLVFEGDRRFDLVVRLPETIRADIESLERLPIPLPKHDSEETIIKTVGFSSKGGTLAPPYVPLGSIAKIVVAEGPNQISRENGKRRIVVQANVRGRDLGSFVAEAQSRIGNGVKIPAGMWLEWGGQFENLVAARERLMIVVPICFLLIFLLLFSTFNSVKYATLVFSGVPLALTGGIFALWIRGMPFSISAAVGFIALSGVAVLNGLVMVTFINHMRKEGAPLERAIIQGSLTRLRPVLMTAMVASFGFVPMAVAHGAGAEVQKPLATVVIGGIISSTILTLIILPALYRIWHRADAPFVSPGDEEHLMEAEPLVD